MSIRTNAIMFWRANAAVGSLPEYYTDATAGTVDTQATAIASGGKFTGGTFSGVYVQYAIKLTNALMNNTLNDSSTRPVAAGTPTVIWGALDQSQSTLIQFPTTELVLANSGNDDVDVSNHNFWNVTGPSTTFTISGFEAPSDGSAQLLKLWNLTSQTMQLLNNNSGSAVGNRIITGTAATREVVGNGSVEFVYDAAANGWVITAIDVAGSAGTGTVTSVAMSPGTTGLTTAGGPITSSGTFTLAGTLVVANGGTGATTLTNHGVLVGQATGAVVATAAGTAGQPLLSGGASADPAFAATLALANGGTGASTFSGAQNALGFVVATIASPVTTTGQVLVDATGLRIAMAANETWAFKFVIRAGSDDVAGIKVGLNIPDAATMVACVAGTDLVGAASEAVLRTSVITADATASIAYAKENSQDSVIIIEGTCVNGANAGDLQLQFLKVTSGTATIGAGSLVQGQRIS